MALRRNHISNKAIKVVILDEADEMLAKGFKDKVYDKYRYLPPNIYCVVVSATLP